MGGWVWPGVDGSVVDRWIALDKESRIPISAFRLALRHQGIEADEDEVECLVAGMIWKASLGRAFVLQEFPAKSRADLGVFFP